MDDNHLQSKKEIEEYFIPKGDHCKGFCYILLGLLVIWCAIFLISGITVLGYNISGEIKSTQKEGKVESQQDGKVTIKFNSGKVFNVTILEKSIDNVYLPVQYFENFRLLIDDYKSFDAMTGSYLQFYKIDDKYYVGHNCMWHHYSGQYKCGRITSSLVYYIALSCVTFTCNILIYNVCAIIILGFGLAIVAILLAMIVFGLKLIYDGFTMYCSFVEEDTKVTVIQHV